MSSQTAPRGPALLRDPLLNRVRARARAARKLCAPPAARPRPPARPAHLTDTARATALQSLGFSSEQRDALGVRGLLPPACLDADQMVHRELLRIRREPTSLGKYERIAALQDRDEHLFLALLLRHTEELTPIVYVNGVTRPRTAPRRPAPRARRRARLPRARLRLHNSIARTGCSARDRRGRRGSRRVSASHPASPPHISRPPSRPEPRPGSGRPPNARRQARSARIPLADGGAAKGAPPPA